MAQDNSLTSWKNRALRLRSQLENKREEAKHAAAVANTSVMTIAGGALAGAVAAKMPYVPGTTVPAPAALGLAAVGAAMSGMLDEQSHTVAAIGSGMLAAMAAREAEKLLRA